MDFWFEIVVVSIFARYLNKYTENLFVDKKER